MKPIVKWSGGKRDELDSIKSHFPSKYEMFVEPFVGGGAVYFNIEPQRAVISDTHEELINFYQQLAGGKGDEIHSLMSNMTFSKEEYYATRDKYEPQNDVERAFKFFYLRKTCYRGMLRQSAKGHFNVPYGFYKKINYDTLKDSNVIGLLWRTIILCEDFTRVFEQFNSKDNFFFLDPPYDTQFRNYGSGGFTTEQQEKLAEYVKTTKNQCLLVIGESDLTKRLYKDMIVETYFKKYAFKLHSGRVGKEINNNHLVVKYY